uniref:TELO2 interacting protein 2 n=1 Tax=Myotis myotis TaxID=51298 RepID=A0A7J7Z9U1_MYOMY|nr:TELO2 interacting protein 2 [Myotis myotis]
MEREGSPQPPPREGSSPPGERPASDLGQALSQILHRLTGPESRRGSARNAALQDLSALLEATGCDRLFAGSDTPLGGAPGTLGAVTAALEKHAAPRKEEGGADGCSAVAEKAAAVGLLFTKLLRRVESAKESPGCLAWKRGLRHLAGPIYVFAITHSLQQPWTRPGAREVAREVLALLLRVTECGSVAGFLHGEHEGEKGRFAEILGLLQPDLNKESWKNNPATKHVFSWTLQQVTRPWLNQHLERILPPSLLISDDYQIENKVLGVHCLHHIVLNVPAADLLQYNRAQVLYHALFNHLYTPEHHLIQLILTHMEPEHRILLRRTYARNLPAFVKRLGILTVRHWKRLERVILGYLEVYDGPEEEARLKTLETLKLLMQYTWPRVSCRLVVLLKALLKLICDVARDSSLTPETVKGALLEEATDCLLLLDRCSQGQVKGLLAKIPQSCKDSKVVECVRKVQLVSEGAPYSGTKNFAVLS